MGGRRIVAVALTGALVAGGAGAAIAAVSKRDAKKPEQAVLDDAAKRLNVTTEKLRDALAAAQDAQIDEAAKDGKLTRRQADAIKQARKQSGHVLGPIPPGVHGKFFGPGFAGKHPFGMRHGLHEDIAEALGTTPRKLVESLRSGKSVGDIAKANGKTLAEVRTAVKAAVKARLDKAVKNGDLTQKQADRFLGRLDEKLAAIESGKALRLRRHRQRHHHGGMPPGAPDEIRPGGLLPGDEAPQLAPAPGTSN